jgi:PTH1 family peptidyl-tRNA hydrolase
VGLGNPEACHASTRHNVGFMVLEELRRRHGLGRARSKFHARCWTGRLSGRAVTLLEPQTYMNRSGLAVQEAMAFRKVQPDQVLVVLDDLALPLGRLRARAGGSSGGHKGLEDILRAAGTDRLSRLRVGIGPPQPGRDAVEHVLEEFHPDERTVMNEAVARAADAVEDWLANGITYVMDHYNPDTQVSARTQNGKEE